MRTHRTKLTVAIAVAGLVAASGSAFTNSNTVEGTLAGQGSGAITGYAVTQISYTYTASQDGTTQFDKVRFHLDKPASRVEARVAGSGVAYGDCAEVVENVEYGEYGWHTVRTGVWNCDLVDVDVADGTALDVFATDDETQLP